MCGIAGFFGRSSSPGDSAVVLRSMLAMIRHRGPDEFGYCTDGGTGLATARLKVIDLLLGQQPLSDPSGRYHIAYNGEAYNFSELRQELEKVGCRFHSHSDTEVVLNCWIAWGVAGFARINGGFAAAIYDRQEKKLVLARDLFGKRPLYYFQQGSLLVFASEIKALLACPEVSLNFDESSLHSIFTLWTPLPDQSCFRGVRQLPNASCMILHRGGLSIQNYADPYRADPSPKLSHEDLVEHTRARVGAGVRRRLVADIEVGAYLSGGLDSSIVCQQALEHNPGKVRSFSVAFADEAFNEEKEQNEVAQALGLEHAALRIQAGDIAAAFPDALWHAETPVFRTAFVPMFLLSAFARRHGVHVILSGEGADEAFLGYEIFRESLVRQKWKTLQNAEERSAILRTLYHYLEHFQGDSARAIAGVFEQFQESPSDLFWTHRLRFHNSSLSARLLGRKTGSENDLDSYVASQVPSYSSMAGLRKGQCLEFLTLLHGYLLSTQGDRMSFAHGVELRCPFLDPDLVHWTFSLPVQDLLGDDLKEKKILREAFAGKLPKQILNRQKQPYRAPGFTAFAGSSAPAYLDCVYSEQELKKLPFLDLSFCQRFLDKIRKADPNKVSPREDHAFLQLLSLALLHRDFVEKPRQAGSIDEEKIKVRTLLAPYGSQA